MKHDFEYNSYTDSERLVMLENRAAELERMLKQVTPDGDTPEYDAREQATMEFPAFAPPHATELYADSGRGRHDIDRYPDTAPDEYLPDVEDDPEPQPRRYAEAPARPYRAGRSTGPRRVGDRTEALINRGRRHVRYRLEYELRLVSLHVSEADEQALLQRCGDLVHVLEEPDSIDADFE